MTLRKITWEELLALFTADLPTRDSIKGRMKEQERKAKLATAQQEVVRDNERVRTALHHLLLDPQVTHVVVFENLQLDSSERGRKSAMPVGSNNTFKTLEAVQGRWLGDLPSRRRYPTMYFEKLRCGTCVGTGIFCTACGRGKPDCRCGDGGPVVGVPCGLCGGKGWIVPELHV